MNEGERVVSLEGIEGKALVSFEEFYLDGVKIAHTETDRKTIVEAINEVVKIGTALVVEETKPVASTNPAPESKPTVSESKPSTPPIVEAPKPEPVPVEKDGGLEAVRPRIKDGYSVKRSSDGVILKVYKGNEVIGFFTSASLNAAVGLSLSEYEMLVNAWINIREYCGLVAERDNALFCAGQYINLEISATSGKVDMISNSYNVVWFHQY